MALNSSRKRRREGVADIPLAEGLGPGGRGGTREAVSRSPRYKKAKGKAKWIFQPVRTQWYLNFVENEDLAADPSTVLGRDFESKFRIPHRIFKEILDATRASGLFPDDLKPHGGQKPHPLSMKVMAALRRLALGVPLDGLECMCGISDTRLRDFIDTWEPWFVETYHPQWVKMPEGEMLDKAQRLFEACGLAGFISSMDVVHLKYDRCPHGQRALYAGKEGYPTIGYQFHCGHNRQIFWHSPQGFPGARNDKTVVRYDDFLKEIKSNPLYSEREYQLLVQPGISETAKGVHTLCDGGYHRWNTTICGAKHTSDPDLKAFSGLCESVRKDIECVFGILKKKFRILNVPQLEHDPSKIDRLVHVCSILHNMVLHHKGLDAIGEEEHHWTQVDAEEARRYGLKLSDLTSFTVGSMAPYNNHEEQEVHEGWDAKRLSLVKHYTIALQTGQVGKLRTRAEREAAEEEMMDG